MKKLLCLLLLIFFGTFFLPKSAYAVAVKSVKWFDNRVYFIDFTPAQSIFGETVRSIVSRTKAVYGVNATYFGKFRSTNGYRITPIGDIYCHLQNLSLCGAPADRGYVWQTEKIEIGFKPPEITICTIPAGPILVLRGTLFPSFPQNFDAKHWNLKCLRTVVGIKGHHFYLMKIYGNLWQIGKFLHYRHFTDVINLDGGSSSTSGAIVANALTVFRKSRPFYSQFSAKYFTKQQPPNNSWIDSHKNPFSIKPSSP